MVHAGCPRAAETIKWGMPAFVHEGNLCFIAAFKAHVGLVFAKGRKVVPPSKSVSGAMGQFGRITSLADLPPRGVLVGYVQRAAALNEAGAAARRKPARRTLTAPPKPRAARPAARGRAPSPNPGTRNARRRAAR